MATFILILCLCPLLLTQILAQDFDFYYFVQQWPGSYCDTRHKCCFPLSGKPAADFSIHGLWPNRNDGSYPTSCDSQNSFDISQISDFLDDLTEVWDSLSCPRNDGKRFWQHEWEKHGTCSESFLDQRSYFQTALKLKSQVDILSALRAGGIEPDDGEYSIRSIRNAIAQAVGQTPGIECNKDAEGRSQLYQVFLCVATNGSKLIPCPVFPHTRCSSEVRFPAFGDVKSESSKDEL